MLRPRERRRPVIHTSRCVAHKIGEGVVRRSPPTHVVLDASPVPAVVTYSRALSATRRRDGEDPRRQVGRHRLGVPAPDSDHRTLGC